MKDILGLFQLTNTLIAQQIIFDRFYILNLFQEYWFWSVILIQIQSALEYGNNTDPYSKRHAGWDPVPVPVQWYALFKS